MSEDSVIRKRLAIEGDSGQDDKRIAGLLKTLLKWCAADNLSQEENEATYQKIMFTLTQVGVVVFAIIIFNCKFPNSQFTNCIHFKKIIVFFCT